MANYNDSDGWRATRKQWYHGDRSNRVVELSGWPTTATASGRAVYARPKPWLVRVGSNSETESIEWFTRGVEEFLAAALRDVEQHAVPFERARPLICVPFVGAGFGGAADRVGALIQSLFAAAERFVQACNCDLAFVTLEATHYAAAQAVRQQRDPFGGLSSRLREQATKLARTATGGSLAVFVGAGVSMSCGLPSWNKLLERLADAAGLTAAERAWLADMSFLDQARILERRLGGAGRLQQSVAELIDTDFLALGHALLASLPVQQYITTNYDLHLERALRCCGRPFRVIPYAEPDCQPTACFVLKLHGCVRHPEDIVLTRDDYLRYGDRRSALAGVVSTALITQHLLFVGFSLSDDNFHNINSVVRKISPSTGRTNATALQLGTNPLIMELNDNIEIVSMTEPGCSLAGPAVAAASRDLEIFLDMLACHVVSPVQHLLDPTFDPLLSPDERELRAALVELDAKIPQPLRGTAFFDRLQCLFTDFGARSHSSYRTIDPFSD